MDQQTIDRLFREKLDGNEVAPSPKSWSEVEKQIGGKKKPTILWIAASISLLALTWFFWSENQMNSIEIASQEIDHPVLLENSELTSPVAVALQEQRMVHQRVRRIAKARPLPAAVASVPISTEEVLEVEGNVLPEDSKSLVAVEETSLLPDADAAIEAISKEVVSPVYKPVKITYIAASSKQRDEVVPAKNDSTGVLKKFIAFTEKIAPGEVLADLKTAKDNLLNGGLKNKKDRTIMTP